MSDPETMRAVRLGDLIGGGTVLLVWLGLLIYLGAGYSSLMLVFSPRGSRRWGLLALGGMTGAVLL